MGRQLGGVSSTAAPRTLSASCPPSTGKASAFFNASVGEPTIQSDECPPNVATSTRTMGADEKPDVTYADIGGGTCRRRRSVRGGTAPTHVRSSTARSATRPASSSCTVPPAAETCSPCVSPSSHELHPSGRPARRSTCSRARGARDVFRLVSRMNSPSIIFIDEVSSSSPP